MILPGRQTILCLLLLLSPIVSVQSQSTVDKAPASTIAGKITVGGKGVAGVVVGLVIREQGSSNSQPTRFRSTTDEDGNYRITKVPPGTYDVIPASPAFVVSEGRKSVIVGKNETVENIDIALERGGVITGTVTDAEGRPVIEEMVYLSPATAQRLEYSRNVRTDDRGIYRAYGVPPGRYRIFAGRDATSRVGDRGSEGGHQRTYHPSAVDPNEATVIDVSDGTEATNVDITLRESARTYIARGRIIDSDTSQPMPKIPVGVQIFRPDGSKSRRSSGNSTNDGEFIVDGLTPGKYAVYSAPAVDSEWLSEPVEFEITNQDVEGLLIKNYRGASISGVVVLEGTNDTKVRAKLFAGRVVGQIVENQRGPSSFPATINPNGSFRITGVAAGRLMLQLQTNEPFRVLRLERHGIVQTRVMEIREREQVTNVRMIVGLANGTIRGVISLPSGMELPSPPRLRVALRRMEDAVRGSYGAPIDADARGHFRFEGLIPGTYEIAVSVFLNAPNAQSSSIPPTRQTVVVTNGVVSEVTVMVQIPQTTPQRP